MYSTTNESSSGGEGETAQLHDWLRLVEQKIKSLNVTLGDEDDMSAAVQKQNVSCWLQCGDNKALFIGPWCLFGELSLCSSKNLILRYLFLLDSGFLNCFFSF